MTAGVVLFIALRLYHPIMWLVLPCSISFIDCRCLGSRRYEIDGAYWALVVTGSAGAAFWNGSHQIFAPERCCRQRSEGMRHARGLSSAYALTWHTRGLRAIARSAILSTYTRFAQEESQGCRHSDHEQDNADRRAGRRIARPVIALWRET